MERAFMAIGALFGLLGVGLGAFASHALRRRLGSDRLATFEIGVRYQLWHALALFAVVLVGSIDLVEAVTEGSSLRASRTSAMFTGTLGGPAALAGWLFVAGTVLFSSSLYVLALTGKRRWGMVAPFGGTCFILGWAFLALAALTA